MLPMGGVASMSKTASDSPEAWELVGSCEASVPKTAGLINVLKKSESRGRENMAGV